MIAFELDELWLEQLNSSVAAARSLRSFARRRLKGSGLFSRVVKRGRCVTHWFSCISCAAGLRCPPSPPEDAGSCCGEPTSRALLRRFFAGGETGAAGAAAAAGAAGATGDGGAAGATGDAGAAAAAAGTAGATGAAVVAAGAAEAAGAAAAAGWEDTRSATAAGCVETPLDFAAFGAGGGPSGVCRMVLGLVPSPFAMSAAMLGLLP
eukprot:Hpha_TRINITY_DN16265_c0_g7::TRINITY_DN16265_c0_g7_i1::g.12068::m.12068